MRSLDSSFADPPYPAAVLFGPGEERGCIVVFAGKLTPETVKAPAQFVPADHLDRWPPRWQIRAALVWFAPGLQHPLCEVADFLLGDRIFIPPRIAPAVVDNPEIPVAVLREALQASWGARDELTRQLTGMPDPRLGLLDRMAEEQLRVLDTETANDAAGVSNIVVTAFSLLNAKNIMREAAQATQSRASRRRGDPPPYRHHILTVAVPSVQRAASESQAVTEEHVPIHWVRGHFKRYTSDKPLFGRFVGVYWWQPHLAGRGHGFVDKDYRVNLTGEPT
jgi:hypothetical protein